MTDINSFCSSIEELCGNGNPKFWNALNELNNSCFKPFFEKPEIEPKALFKSKGIKRKQSVLKRCLNCNHSQQIIHGKRVSCLKCNKPIPSREGGKKKCTNCGNLEYNRTNTCSRCNTDFKCLKKKIKLIK